jgi:hypothetical protein
MIDDALRLLWVVAAPAGLGVLCLRALGVRAAQDRLGYAAWLWPLGCLCLAAALWLLLALDVPPSLWWLAPPLAAAPLLPAAWRGAPHPRPLPVPLPWSRFGQLVFAALVLLGLWLAVYLAVAAAGTPCVFGDEGNLWSMKAKALYVDWPLGAFREGQRAQSHPDYPLLNPLLQAWVYSQFGAVELFLNRVPIQLCTVSLWLATCAAVRRLLPPWLGALLLVPLLLDAEFRSACSTAYADGMLALGLVLALDGWLRCRALPPGAPAAAPMRALLVLGLAFALWSKNEGALYVAAAIGAAVLTARLPRAPWWPGAVWLWPCAVVAAQWTWNRWFGFTSDLLGGPPSPGVGWPRLFAAQWQTHAPRVLQAGIDLLFSPASAAGVLLVPLPALLLRTVRQEPRLRAPALALLLSVLGLHLVYVGTWIDLDLHLRTSHARVVGQLVPAAIVWLAAVVAALRAPAPGAALSGRPTA